MKLRDYIHHLYESSNPKIVILIIFIILFIVIFLITRIKKKSEEERSPLEHTSYYILILIPIVCFKIIKQEYSGHIKDYSVIIALVKTGYILYVALFLFSAFTRHTSNYVAKMTKKYPNLRKELVDFVFRILKIFLFIVVFLYFLVQVGVDIKAILASLGIGGIAIAFAVKDTLLNLFASINVILDNTFSKGDWIVVDKYEGTVVDIKIRSTTIRTFDNAYITVPNSLVVNHGVINYSKRMLGRRIKMSLNITYESGMKNIKSLKDDIFKMLQEHEDIADSNTKMPKGKHSANEDLVGVKKLLMVNIDEFNSSSIDILVYCFTKSIDWQDFLDIKEDIMIKIDELVSKNSCEYAYPSQTLFVKK